MEKAAKSQKSTAPAQGVKAPNPAPAAPPSRLPPLFRGIDWFALAFTFVVIWVVYFLTLAPELTLEDSGELCTGSFYAGIPHPPGYPFWAIYSFLWTKLLPFGNVAWRVEVGEATAAAMACGLVAFVVSRGSSMLMEGIEELREVSGKWENAICLVSGIVAGLMLGLGGVMWSESVAINRISLFGVPWVMIVLLCLLRWIYAPHQMRYLYCGLFFFGICATIHQSLLVAAMGIEIVVVFAQPRLGRNMLFGNVLVYLAGLAAQSAGFSTMLDTATTVLVIYHAVGILSLAGFIWMSVLEKEGLVRIGRDAVLTVLSAVVLVLFLGSMKMPILFLLFFVGLGALVWMAWKTRDWGWEWLVVLVLGVLWLLGASFYFYEPIAGMTNPPMEWGYPRTVEGFFHALSRGQYEKANPTDVLGDPNRFLMQLGMLVGDIAHEFNWVCPFVALVPLLFFFKMQKRERAWIGGLAAIYLCIGGLLMILMNPTPERQSADLIKVFFTSSHAVVAILFGYGLALTASYMATHYQRFRVVGLMLAAVTLLPALTALYNGVDNTFYGAAGWMPPKTVLYLVLCLTATFVLTALAAQSYLRSSREPGSAPQNERLFFMTYAVVAFICLSLSVRLAFFNGNSLSLHQVWLALPRIFAPNQYALPVIAGLLIFGIAVAFLAALILYRHRAPLVITLGLFAVMPLASGLAHWAGSEQRNHWFGYWFGHDMFTPPYKDKAGKPLYPLMAKDTILFGGTDPGRFCPTYMIFCDSFLPTNCLPAEDPTFDRRDVYLITQNALADGTYLCYLRAQYYRSQQIDPPFFSELARFVLKDKEYETNLLARMVSPLDTLFMARGANIERRWRTFTSWFTPKDFLQIQSFAKCLANGNDRDPVSQWLFENCSKETQDLIQHPGDENRLREALAEDLNRLLVRELNVAKERQARQQEKDAVDQQISEGDNSASLRSRAEALARELDALKVNPLYTTNRFAHVAISDYLQAFIAQDPQSDTRIRLNRLLLEAAYPNEIAKSLGGVYPDREIYIPSNEDSQRCFKDYIDDAAARLAHDRQFPGEPKQLKPGEGVTVDNASGKVQVSGQVSVMAINGLLTKVIFDHNPINEFYVEESFPLDWMYPHLTPYGIIMKINRQPVAELSQDICDRDHSFWSQFSERLIGNWITYETPVSQIVDWIEKVYLGRNFTGFIGDRRFVRDDEAQKAFSKLRSSIAGVYAWRLGMSPTTPTPPEYLPKNDAERQRMIKEADFAFRQAFAFCPYSPEAVFHYVQFLMTLGRVDDAVMIAKTCRKLDPENGAVVALQQQLEAYRKAPQRTDTQIRNEVEALESELKSNPTDAQKAFELAARYMQLQRPDRAYQILDGILANPQSRPDAVLAVAQAYAQINNLPKLEAALDRLVKMLPSEPEVWFNLAEVKVGLGKSNEGIDALRHAVQLSDARLARDPKAHDLRAEAEKDARFTPLRNLPDYKAFMAK